MIYQFLRDIDYPRSLYVPFVIKVDETDQKSKGISVSLDLFKHQFGIALQGIERAPVEKRDETKQLVEKIETLWRPILLLTALTNRQPLLTIKFRPQPPSSPYLLEGLKVTCGRKGRRDESKASTNPPLSFFRPSTWT